MQSALRGQTRDVIEDRVILLVIGRQTNDRVVILLEGQMNLRYYMRICMRTDILYTNVRNQLLARTCVNVMGNTCTM